MYFLLFLPYLFLNETCLETWKAIHRVFQKDRGENSSEKQLVLKKGHEVMNQGDILGSLLSLVLNAMHYLRLCSVITTVPTMPGWISQKKGYSPPLSKV